MNILTPRVFTVATVTETIRLNSERLIWRGQDLGNFPSYDAAEGHCNTLEHGFSAGLYAGFLYAKNLPQNTVLQALSENNRMAFFDLCDNLDAHG